MCGSDRLPVSYMYLNRKHKDEDVIACLIVSLEYLEQLYKETREGGQKDTHDYFKDLNSRDGRESVDVVL